MSQAVHSIEGWLPLRGRWLRYGGIALGVTAFVIAAELGFPRAALGLGTAALLLQLAEGKGRLRAWWWAALTATAIGWLSFAALSTSVEVALTFYGRTSWQCGTCAASVLDRNQMLTPLMLAAAVGLVRTLADGPLRFLARVAVLTGITAWAGLLVWVAPLW